MSASTPPAATGQTGRHQGLPLVVAVGSLLALGGLLTVVALRALPGSLSPVAARIASAVGIALALLGFAISGLAAVLTRPGTGRRGFALSLVALLLAAAVVGFATHAVR